MKELPIHISQYIESQFPAIFREEGPVLVQFVTAYYEWMESTGQPLFHSRRLPSYRDIDTTMDDFVTHFKLKYLPNIQFTTASSRRMFVKHALDFHRSKGSERSVELFFKLIYGVAASIYYPGDDLFRVSDGEWIVPTYIEISPSPHNKEFVGQTIQGVSSFAIAFVESYNRIRVKGKYIELFYLSNLEGAFERGELLKADVLRLDNPRVQGSVSSIEVVSGGANFFRGEKVGFISDNGSFATGLVAEVSNVVGAANTELVNGGYGYNSTSEVIISDKSLQVDGLVNNEFIPLETIEELYSNGDVSSTATVVGSSKDFVVVGSLITGDITLGQNLSQGSVSGVITRVQRSGQTFTINLANVVNGTYKTGQQASSPSGNINVASYGTLVGIANISGPGTFARGSLWRTQVSGVSGSIVLSTTTSNAMSFSLTANNRFDNMSQANVGLDYLAPYANLPLDSAAYGLPKDPAAGLDDLMIDALHFETRNYGTVTNNTIVGLYGGSGYSQRPFAVIYEELPYKRFHSDFVLEIDNQVSSFIPGERVITGTRAANGAYFASSDPVQGLVLAATPNETVTVQRLSVYRLFSEHDPQNFAIIGETSGAAARIKKANVTNKPLYTGLNADLKIDVFRSGGLVLRIDPNTSGYGYVNDELITFYSLEDPNKTGLARLKVETHGVGQGYYGTKGGSLSDTKRLQDNHYYQEFSYEIRTSVQEDTYKQMFDQVLHVAGTKGFSAYLSEKAVDASISIADSQLITD